jgi:predicted dehydrogenase
VGARVTIRVGIIGCGYWGPKLLRNFANNAAFEVVAVADRKPHAREEAARTKPGIIQFEEASDLLARDDIDAVVIATPVATHYPMAKAALEKGKHVLVEKPMCRTVAEAEELVAMARRLGRVLMVDHTFLFTGAVQTMAKIVKSGQLGKICYFDSMRLNLGLFQSDVNCLWDLAPHDLSIVDHLLEKDFISISVSGYCHINPSLPDMIYLTLHYADHTVAHFNLSWMSPVKVRRFAVGGTRSMLIWDDLDPDQKIRIYNSGIEVHSDDQRPVIIPGYRIGDIYSPRVPQQEALFGVVQHFGRVIRGEEASLMDGEKGLRVIRVLEAVQEQLDRKLEEISAIEGTVR